MKQASEYNKFNPGVLLLDSSHFSVILKMYLNFKVGAFVLASDAELPLC